ncbi:MAG: DNA-directed RNA polymerase subunit N [Candidatus Micrarchaeota archaeon]|nr:DNA-directed RNA polymerase subunit N [Candidatus Micrarchaeota archaeon]
MMPVRCFSCGSVVADKYEKFAEKVKSGQDPAKALDELGVRRYCCRRMFLGHVDILDDIIHHAKC